MPSREGVCADHNVSLGNAHVYCSGESRLEGIWLGRQASADGNREITTFKFDALTKEGERIYCLDTWIRLDYRDQNDQQV